MVDINLIGGFRYPETSIEIFYKEGLEELGHDVHIPPKLSNDADLSIVIKHTPDPEALPGVKCLIFTDNYARGREYLDSVLKESVYDRVFLPNLDPEIEEHENLHWLPCGFSKKYHYPLNRDRNIMVLFCGTAHPSRLWMKDLPKALVTIYGNGWGGNITPVYGREKMELYARAFCILNSHYSKLPGPNMRFFESLACRRLQICDRVVGPKELGFVEGRDFIVYEGFDDLVGKMQYYVIEDEEREKIATAGYKKVILNGHTYTDRMRSLLEVCGF